MAREETTVCDRCRTRVDPDKVHVIALNFDSGFATGDQGVMDLCTPCFEVLRSWLGYKNGVTPGDSGHPAGARGPGWREVCTHNIPCGGACSQPAYRRVI